MTAQLPDKITSEKHIFGSDPSLRDFRTIEVNSRTYATPPQIQRRHFGVLGPSRLFEGLLCDMIFPNVSIVSVTVCMVA
jgi:hypothetical protein